MKRYSIHILLILTAITAGTILLGSREKQDPDETVKNDSISGNVQLIEQDQTDTEEAASQPPAPVQMPDTGPPDESPPSAIEPTIPEMPESTEPRRARQRAPRETYWQRADRRFNGLWDLLDAEQDPERRLRLIESMARHVRIDTLTAIEWAMTITDPAEKRAALAAINENALVGIGAKIGIDETGFPSIQNTTVMSAIESTGMVAPGDYIVGMQDDTGDYVSFDGMNIRQVVRHLRGEAGSDALLHMERIDENTGESVPFEVSVRRSLLVIEPPLQ